MPLFKELLFVFCTPPVLAEHTILTCNDSLLTGFLRRWAYCSRELISPKPYRVLQQAIASRLHEHSFSQAPFGTCNIFIVSYKVWAGDDTSGMDFAVCSVLPMQQ